MTVRPILRWPDPVLSTRCAPVARIDDGLMRLIDDMFDTMYAAPGRGLAAPQVGVLSRVFVMDVSWKDGPGTPLVMINPELGWASDETVTMTEGCLSIPGITTDILRPASVDMTWTGPDGTQQARRLEGSEARCAQHELDHLNGVVTFDRLDDADREVARSAYEAARG